MMKRITKIALLVLLIAARTFAQFPGGTPTNPVGANLAVQDAGICSTSRSFLWQKLPTNAGTTTVNLAGTFSATVTVRESNNGGGTWTTAGTQTTVATAAYSTNGFTDICADVTTYVSGTVNVTISTGLQQVQSTITIPGAGAPVSVTAINVTAPPFNAKNDARFLQGSANGCFGTNGSPVVNCNAAFFKTDGTDVGRNFMMFQNNVGLGGATYFQSTTVCSVQSTTQATMCNNNTGSTLTTGFANLVTQIIGTDARAAIRAAQAAMTNTFNQVYFPCGVYYVTDSFINGSEVTGVTAGPFGWVGESGGSDGGGCVTFIWPQDSPYTLLCANSALLACINAPGPGGPAYVENLTFDALGMVNASTNPVAKITSARGHTTNLTFRGMNYNSAGTYTYVHSADDTTETNINIQAGDISASGVFHQSVRTTYINPHIFATGTGSVGFNVAELNSHIFGGQISAGGTNAVALLVAGLSTGAGVSLNARVYGTCLNGAGTGGFAVDATSASSAIPSIDLFSVALGGCSPSGAVGLGGGIRIGTSGGIVRCAGCWFTVPSAVNGLTTVAGAHFFDLGGSTPAGTNSIAAGTIHGALSITGTPQTSGNWSVPPGAGAGQWGTSPSVGSCSGFSRLQQCTITVGSGTVGTNPILTITHPTLIGSTNTGTSALAGFLTAPICRAQQVGGTQAVGSFTTTTSTATTASFTAQTTPTASNTIILQIECDLP